MAYDRQRQVALAQTRQSMIGTLKHYESDSKTGSIDFIDVARLPSVPDSQELAALLNDHGRTGPSLPLFHSVDADNGNAMDHSLHESATQINLIGSSREQLHY